MHLRNYVFVASLQTLQLTIDGTITTPVPAGSVKFSKITLCVFQSCFQGTKFVTVV